MSEYDRSVSVPYLAGDLKEEITFGASALCIQYRVSWIGGRNQIGMYRPMTTSQSFPALYGLFNALLDRRSSLMKYRPE